MKNNIMHDISQFQHPLCPVITEQSLTLHAYSPLLFFQKMVQYFRKNKKWLLAYNPLPGEDYDFDLQYHGYESTPVA